MGGSPFICSQPVPLLTLLWGRVPIALLFVDSSGVNSHWSLDDLANERLNIQMAIPCLPTTSAAASLRSQTTTSVATNQECPGLGQERPGP